jgi:hypothetical protein
MIRFAACALLFAETSLAASVDYYAIDGVYITTGPGEGILGHCNLAPTNKPYGYRQPSCQSVLGPEVDLGHENDYPRVALPGSLLLSLANLNHADRAASSQFSSPFFNNWVNWYPRTSSLVSKQTTYFHKTRCADGEGEHVTTDKSVYKKCNAGSVPAVNNTFHLPASACLATCDEDVSCIGYTIHEAGTLCSVLQGGGGVYAYFDYGWIGQQSGSGFSDLAPSILHYNWF